MCCNVVRYVTNKVEHVVVKVLKLSILIFKVPHNVTSFVRRSLICFERIFLLQYVNTYVVPFTFSKVAVSRNNKEIMIQC